MRPIVVQVGPLAAPSATNIAGSQTPGAAGNLTLTAGAIAKTTPDTPRRVLVTTSADESAKTLVITGTDWNNTIISETMTGPNNTTAYTNYDFKTVTQIAVSAAFTGAVTVGTNGIASSRPIFIDPWAPSQTSLQVVVSGTINYSVQQTLDDPDSPTNAVAYTSVTWVSHPDASLVAATATAQGNYAYSPRMVRILVNSNSNPGSVVMTVIQSSVVPA